MEDRGREAGFGRGEHRCFEQAWLSATHLLSGAHLQGTDSVKLRLELHGLNNSTCHFTLSVPYKVNL